MIRRLLDIGMVAGILGSLIFGTFVGCEPGKGDKPIVKDAPVYYGYGVFMVYGFAESIAVQLGELKRKLPDCRVTAVERMYGHPSRSPITLLVNIEDCDIRAEHYMLDRP